jgi:nitrate reductase gamma subunit
MALNRTEALKEIHMYYGGGILGTILIVALIVFLVRRSRI